MKYNELVKFVQKVNLWNTLKLMIRSQDYRARIVVYPNVHVGIGSDVSLAGNGRLFLGNRWELSRYMPSEIKLLDHSKFEVHGEFLIYTGCSISINPNAKIVLGSGYASNNLVIDCFDEIVIGHGVVISKNVIIRDSDNHMIIGGNQVKAPIHINDHVWIGLNAVILKGVTIGEGAVVAAGSLVNKDVPPGSLVGGVPAKVIKKVSWQ